MAPNVVWIVADDQPKGLMDAMPRVTSLIRQRGVQLNTYITPTALCSPSRAAMLTGKYSHHHGTWTNYNTTTGSWTAFAHNESDTIATRLQGVGYHTSMVGKYMNKFSKADPGYIPPGWDNFIAMRSTGDEGAGAYYNYSLIGTLPEEVHGDTEADYSTDVLRDHAVNVLQYAPAEKPVFLYFAPWGPHANFTPAPRHVDAWPFDTGLYGSFNEVDMSDKPAWMRALPLDSEIDEETTLTKMHQTVMSIDEAAEAIINALGSRLDDCIIIYSSDNGKMMGAHRATHKDLPHRYACEVPGIIRWVGHLPENATDARVTTNHDLTATIAEAAGVQGWQIDGLSYLSKNRTGTILEQMDNPEQEHPAYVGWRTKRYMYVEYTRGENKGKELYDYQTDPDELNNLAFDPAYASLVSQFAATIRQEETSAPPGYVWRTL